jgi:hypothetical protein
MPALPSLKNLSQSSTNSKFLSFYWALKKYGKLSIRKPLPGH